MSMRSRLIKWEIYMHWVIQKPLIFRYLLAHMIHQVQSQEMYFFRNMIPRGKLFSIQRVLGGHS